MLSNECTHKSVGMLVFNGPKLLLIERAKAPFGFAPPAGHVDDDTTFEEAAKRELKEEVGLDTISLSLVAEGRKQNLCRRRGGTWHYWKIYQMQVQGELQRSREETKQAHFFEPAHINVFVERTKRYLAKGTTEHDWSQAPGFQLVWYEWFSELGLI